MPITSSLRLVYDREKLINGFESNKSYSVNAEFNICDKDITALFNKSIENRDNIIELLPILSNSLYKITDFTKKKIHTHLPHLI